MKSTLKWLYNVPKKRGGYVIAFTLIQAVTVGTEAFSGIVRSNKTAAFIVNLLKEETTEGQIIDAMYERFDAPKEEIAADVREILTTLRNIHALEEE